MEQNHDDIVPNEQQGDESHTSLSQNDPSADDDETNSANGTEDGCPICLGGQQNGETLVRGPCRHEFCIPCVERVLTAPPLTTMMNHRILDYNPWPPSEDLYLSSAPTIGRCPICRAQLNLFHLTKVGTDQEELHPKQYDIAHSKIQGMVFIKNGGRVGQESIHFPSCQEQDLSSETNALPYINFERVSRDWKLDDGSDIPARKYFEPGCHFHEQTRTFHGTIRWTSKDDDMDCKKRFRNSTEWNFILGFSSDFRFIARGVFVARKDPCRNPNCISRVDCKFPLDGTWTATSPDDHGNKRLTRTIQVHGNQMALYDTSSFNLLHVSDSNLNEVRFSDPDHATILSVDGQPKYYVTSGLNLRTHPDGPDIGECIEWAAQSSDKLEMIWKRQSICNDNLFLNVIPFGPDHPKKTQYHRLIEGVNNNISGGFPKSSYHPNTVWGNTFCQGLTVGLASYHFLADENAGVYISYEHERTAQWPPLDNGMPVPSKIWFTDITFERETRTFRGKIDWEGIHNTTWQGSRWWR